MLNRILGILLVIALSMPACAAKSKFDYSKYMEKLQLQIKASWNPPRDKISKKAIAGFSIHKDGTISNLKILKSSGSVEFDRLALDTLENVAPFSKLPKKADIEFSFDYTVRKRKGRFISKLPLVTSLKEIKGKSFKFKDKIKKIKKPKKAKETEKKKVNKEDITEQTEEAVEKKEVLKIEEAKAEEACEAEEHEPKLSKDKEAKPKKAEEIKKVEKQPLKSEKIQEIELKTPKKQKITEETEEQLISQESPKVEKENKQKRGFFKSIKEKLKKANHEQKDFKLGLPIDCKLGDECFIMLYPDHDPSPKAKDFTCGRMASDNNKGTVFVIQSETVMLKGIPVIASADGVVYRTRDGIPDRRIDGHDTRSVKGVECGNGVVVNHGNEWQTQYCHMKNGTVKVSVGDEVKKGQLLGYVGVSGESSMPNLDFVVRYQNEAVDPFVGLATDNKEEQKCGMATNPIWKDKLEYSPTGLVRLGFSNEELQLEDSWEGKFGNDNLAKNSEKLIFWAHSYGVLEDDIEELEIYAPDGSLFIKNSSAREKPSRSALIYTGRKNPEDFKKGKWKGKYKLIRQGQVLIDTEKTIHIN